MKMLEGWFGDTNGKEAMNNRWNASCTLKKYMRRSQSNFEAAVLQWEINGQA